MEKLNIPKFDPPLNVLAVDDDATNLLIIEKMLKPYGCIVEKAASGQDALNKVWKKLPDIILLDVMMPGMDGFEVCRNLKGKESTRLVPIIIVTALHQKEDRIKGIQAGCDDFISKPIERLELIARVHALGQVKRLNDDLDHAEAVVLSLARAVEAKDHTTGNHCDRLMRLSRAFGEYLGLDEPDIRTLERVSILHDVGKIGIPDSILLKPGKLTEDEWEMMRQHPILGEEICHPLRSLSDVCPVIRHHHEKWSGIGYPDGLMGESIPYLARVFQILDAFDALTSERPYKRAFSAQDALKTIEDESSMGYWDPTLVKKFREFLNSRDASKPL
ncbi:MAG TPA: response regulator, partial [bacterium]|nr:response regulator [Myxococcales bacterium]HPW45938.1 response regulator [bacterium]HQC51433.1 response regulator [bacterium]